MRYLVRARVKAGCQRGLLDAIDRGTLGKGSVAGGEYLRNMTEARVCPDQTVRWVEVCYCPKPLQEERPYWEEYVEQCCQVPTERVQMAELPGSPWSRHNRRRTRPRAGVSSYMKQESFP